MRYNYLVKRICLNENHTEDRLIHSRGMTLVETLIALGMFVVIIITVGAFQASVFTNERAVSGSLETAQGAQAILRRIAVDMRSTAPSANGSYPLMAASTSSLIFFSDPDGDGTAERISYTLVGTSLMRSVIQPSGSPLIYNSASQSTTTLVSNIRNSAASPIFQYYDQYYTGTSSPLVAPMSLSAVRLIQVSLMLDVDPASSPVPRTYTTQVSLRNLKTNL